MKNLILMSDSYKYSQFNQYPVGTEYVYSYIESRGGDWDKTLFGGLAVALISHLSIQMIKIFKTGIKPLMTYANHLVNMFMLNINNGVMIIST